MMATQDSRDSCSKPSDNRFSNCPPKMSDGRTFTDYRPRCIANFAIVEGNFSLPNSYEYRQYLINNAEDIMSANKKASYAVNSCGPCAAPYNIGTMLPEQNMQKCDASKCSFYTGDPSGLGLGRKYSTNGESSSKNEFLAMKEQEQLKFSNTSCGVTNADKYSSYDHQPVKQNRASIPSGSYV